MVPYDNFTNQRLLKAHGMFPSTAVLFACFQLHPKVYCTPFHETGLRIITKFAGDEFMGFVFIVHGSSEMDTATQDISRSFLIFFFKQLRLPLRSGQLRTPSSRVSRSIWLQDNWDIWRRMSRDCASDVPVIFLAIWEKRMYLINCRTFGSCSGSENVAWCMCPLINPYYIYCSNILRTTLIPAPFSHVEVIYPRGFPVAFNFFFLLY